MTAAPNLLPIPNRVKSLLSGVAVEFYSGGLTDEAGNEIDPPVDATGKVKHYVVLYDGPGTGQPQALDGQVTSAAYDFQLTCAGRDADAVRWVIREVRAALSGQPVDSSGTSRSGLFSEAPGVRPPIRPDRDARPARWFGVLLYDALVI